MSIEAMKQALEALKELKAVMPIFPKDGDCLIGYKDRYNAAQFKASETVSTLRTAIEQAQKQEPVAWIDMAYARLGRVRDKMLPDDVATVQRFLEGNYTAPPSNSINSIKSDKTSDAPRQPLTDEQERDLRHKRHWLTSIELRDAYRLGLRDGEAAHGIKGGA